jgi:1A family penicillin-binding protein
MFRRPGRITRHLVRDTLLAAFAAFFLLSGMFFLWAASLKIPDIESLGSRKVTQSAKIYDRTGTLLLYDLNKDTQRTIVPLEDISRNVKNATVAIEDAQFYQHRGIRVTSIIRAVLANLTPSGYTQGGSTITQQVVKNSILTKDRTIARKLKEWVLAVKLERVYTKDQILALYLNESPYGGALYGIEEAAQAFLGTHARDLTIGQSAYLAALPQAPTYFSPYGTHRTALDTRKDVVLSRMRDLDFITEDEYAKARAEVVEFLPQAASGIRAPHFVFHVQEQLEREFGSAALQENGWNIITSLDITMQDEAEKTLENFAEPNKEQFGASNAALVALDPTNGDILAMLGSRDYFAEDIDGAYNVATALPGRQPGSAFKPFVYAAALLKGYTPDTVLFDAPTQFSTQDGCKPEDIMISEAPCYAPQNYDDKFRGPMTIRDALAQSINVPAVEALYLVGIQSAINLARSMGISTLTNPDQYGLTLVLGGGEVTLLEMVSAYGVFANEGTRTPPRAVLKIEDRAGNIVRSYDPSPERVLDQNVARTVTDILSDDVAKYPTYPPGSPIFFPGYHVAAKTGTTNDTRDTWVVGYTPHLVVGTWAGNNDNSPMVKKVAGLIVVPMWHDFLAKVLATRPDEPFLEPRDTTTEDDKPILKGIWEGSDVSTDPVSGRTSVVANIHSILYWLDKDNPRGARPENPQNDPQFTRWEYAVQLWASQHGIVNGMTIYK